MAELVGGVVETVGEETEPESEDLPEHHEEDEEELTKVGCKGCVWGGGLLVLVIHPTLKCHEFFPPTLIEVLGTLEGKELHLISKQKKAIVERTVKNKRTGSCDVSITLLL